MSRSSVCTRGELIGARTNSFDEDPTVRFTPGDLEPILGAVKRRVESSAMQRLVGASQV
jgi:hypothetical protein